MTQFDVPRGAPAGLMYLRDFLCADQEAELLRQLSELDWDGRGLFRRRGQVVKRREIDFIHNYGRENRRVDKGEPLPTFLEDVRARCAHAVGIDPPLFQQVIASLYRAGAGIDWHVDSVQAFGDIICGVSLAGPCLMQFRRVRGKETSRVELNPRSLVVFTGPARFDFQHRNLPVKATRFSITFRTLRGSISS